MLEAAAVHSFLQPTLTMLEGVQQPASAGNAPYPSADLLSASCGVLLAGQEDQLQIDGINRLIKAMQEIASPTAAAVPAKTKAAQPSTFTVAITDSSGRLISYTGNTSVVAQSSNTSAVARSGNMLQTAAMRTSAPVSTSNPGDAPATAASRSPVFLFLGQVTGSAGKQSGGGHSADGAHAAVVCAGG